MRVTICKAFDEGLAVLCLRTRQSALLPMLLAHGCSVELGEHEGWQALKLALLPIQEVTAVAPGSTFSVCCKRNASKYNRTGMRLIPVRS